MKILLNSIPDVKRFVNKATELDMENVNFISGRHVISCMSIMGIFTLDLSKPIELSENKMTVLQKNGIRNEFANLISE